MDEQSYRFLVNRVGRGMTALHPALMKQHHETRDQQLGDVAAIVHGCQLLADQCRTNNIASPLVEQLRMKLPRLMAYFAENKADYLDNIQLDTLLADAEALWRVAADRALQRPKGEPKRPKEPAFVIFFEVAGVLITPRSWVLAKARGVNPLLTADPCAVAILTRLVAKLDAKLVLTSQAPANAAALKAVLEDAGIAPRFWHADWLLPAIAGNNKWDNLRDWCADRDVSPGLIIDSIDQYSDGQFSDIYTDPAVGLTMRNYWDILEAYGEDDIEIPPDGTLPQSVELTPRMSPRGEGPQP